MTTEEAAERLENSKIGWAYLDQSQFCPDLYNLMGLRDKIIKRPVITTIEVLANPIVGTKTHFVTGYVHKAYPPIYLNLSRNAGFDTAMVIRGTEGGVIPSLKQDGKIHFYKAKNDDDGLLEVNPVRDLEIQQEVSGVAGPITGSSELITNKRTIETTVLVDNNQIIVLGGLIDNDVQEATQRVPFLSRLPLLGRLFRSRNESVVQRNLTVFLRVKILTDSNSVDQVSLEKYNFLRAEGLLSPQKQEILDLTDKQPKEETEANTTAKEPVVAEEKSQQQIRREARQKRREARKQRRQEWQ